MHIVGVIQLAVGDTLQMYYSGRDGDDILAGFSNFSIHLLSV